MNFLKNIKDNYIEKKLDIFITKSKWSIPVFLIVLFIIFELTFTFWNLIANVIDISLNYLYNLIWIENIFFHSIFGWIVWVLVYIPNVVILYFFLFLLQDSWILPRVSYVFDKYLKKVWLSGKGFLSMFLWFGCTVPAILSTDIIKNKKERILTIMTLPFISCSAKIPVFVLLISAFIPDYLQSISMIWIYLFGIFIWLVSNYILLQFLGHKQETLLAHLPQYRIPDIKQTFIKIYKILLWFIIKISKFVIPFSIMITLAFSYPNSDDINKTYWAKIWQSLQTVFTPLWFNDEMSISLIAGLAWKEIIVSTLGSLYYLWDTTNDSRLIHKIQQDSSIDFASAMSYLVFILLYTSCMWAVFTARSELWNYWGVVFFFYPIIIAWIMSFGVYNILNLL